MDPADVLRDLGGAARRGVLLRFVSRRELDRAVRGESVVRDERGVYVLPEADAAVRAAVRFGGAIGLTSAALRHGWAVARVPDRPGIVVGRGRRLPADVRTVADLYVADLSHDQVRDGTTTPEVTLQHCLRRLPYSEALAVADSALREGFGRQALRDLGERAVGPGSRQVRAVCARADGKAANPFESTLRGISHDVPGLDLRPQVWIRDGAWPVRPDLVDERLRLVCEADSFAFHGTRRALAADARRYTMLTVAGWTVLRFVYEDVMFDPGSVRATLLAGVEWTELLSQRLTQRGGAA